MQPVKWHCVISCSFYLACNSVRCKEKKCVLGIKKGLKKSLGIRALLQLLVIKLLEKSTIDYGNKYIKNKQNTPNGYANLHILKYLEGTK